VETNSRRQHPTPAPRSNNAATMSDIFRIELIRKAIHLCSIVIPVVYWFVPRSTAAALLIPLTALIMAVDIARYYIAPVESWFIATFGNILRRHEQDKARKHLSGATYVLLSATLTVLFFPKLIAITSFSALILCDISAALIGRKFGRHRLFNKSLEGTGAFIITGIVLVLLLPKIEYRITEYFLGFIAIVCGAVVEALPQTIDDNLSIPLTVGVVLWGGYVMFLPALNVNLF
jgi:dolichol kinase